MQPQNRAQTQLKILLMNQHRTEWDGKIPACGEDESTMSVKYKTHKVGTIYNEWRWTEPIDRLTVRTVLKQPAAELTINKTNDIQLKASKAFASPNHGTAKNHVYTKYRVLEFYFLLLTK